MNSLKSLCSFAKSSPVTFDQFQQHVEPLLRRELGIEAVVRVFGILEAAENASDAIHVLLPHSAQRNVAYTYG